jgi:transposase-like protein
MPWQETHPVLERQHFAQDCASGAWTMTEHCHRYGISRNTGYKWADRYAQHGPSGLQDQSRAPRSCPHETPADVVALILAEHTRFGLGGAEDPQAPPHPGPAARLARPRHHLRHPGAP